MNVSGVVAGRGDNIQYVHTDSNHTDPIYGIIPAKPISSKDYDREIFGMLLDSPDAILSVFGFSRSFYGFKKKKTYH